MANDELLSSFLYLTGEWEILVNGEDKLKLTILASQGSEVDGVMTSTNETNVDIPVDKKESWCQGSHLHLIGHKAVRQERKTYIIDSKVAADGRYFSGAQNCIE